MKRCLYFGPIDDRRCSFKVDEDSNMEGVGRHVQYICAIFLYCDDTTDTQNQIVTRLAGMFYFYRGKRLH